PRRGRKRTVEATSATTTPSVQDRACPSETPEIPAGLRVVGGPCGPPTLLGTGTNVAQLVVGHYELDVRAFAVSVVLDPCHLETVMGGRSAVLRFELEKVGAGAANGRPGRARRGVAAVDDDGFEDAEPLSRLRSARRIGLRRCARGQ